MKIKLKKPILPDWATLEYDNGITSFDPEKLVLHLEPEQKGGFVSGNVLQERLSNEGSINLAVLQYLVKNPKLIPNEWKGKWVYGWGTIVRYRDGRLGVPGVYDGGDWVVLGWDWLDDGWDSDRPAARFASSLPLDLESRIQTLEDKLTKIWELLKI